MSTPKNDEKEDINDMNFHDGDMKRSKMHKREFIEWMKKRKLRNVHKKYLYYPEEMRRNMEIKKVFISIDKDESRALDMDEIFEMFHKYDFHISKEDLEKLFQVVDEDKDNALNWKEFKRCALDEEANSVFTNMMRELREHVLAQRTAALSTTTATVSKGPAISSSRPEYMPVNFGNMISFLSYRSTRDDIEAFLKEKNLGIMERYKLINDLFKLTEEYQKHDQEMQSILAHSSGKQKQQMQQSNEDSGPVKIAGVAEVSSRVSQRNEDLSKFFNDIEKTRQAKRILRQKESIRYDTKKNIIALPPCDTADLPRAGSIPAKLYQTKQSSSWRESLPSLTAKDNPNGKGETISPRSRLRIKTLKTQQERTNPLTMQLRTQLPSNLREIDRLMTRKIQLHNSTKQNTEGNIFSFGQQVQLVEKRKEQKLSQLRKEVENYITIARDRYGIDVSEIQLQDVRQKEQLAQQELKNELLALHTDFNSVVSQDLVLEAQNNSLVQHQTTTRQLLGTSSIPSVNNKANLDIDIAPHLKNTNAVPGKLLRGVERFRKIDEDKLYKTLGHSFYSKFIKRDPPQSSSDTQSSGQLRLWKSGNTTPPTQQNAGSGNLRETLSKIDIEGTSARPQQILHNRNSLPYHLYKKSETIHNTKTSNLSVEGKNYQRK